MIIFISLIVLIVAGLYLQRYYRLETLGFMLTLFSSIGLVVAAIAIPISYFEYKSQIAQYYVTKNDIEQSRKSSLTDIERAALTTRIIELNRDLADAKYYNSTIFGFYIPDEVMDLEYLK